MSLPLIPGAQDCSPKPGLMLPTQSPTTVVRVLHPESQSHPLLPAELPIGDLGLFLLPHPHISPSLTSIPSTCNSVWNPPAVSSLAKTTIDPLPDDGDGLLTAPTSSFIPQADSPHQSQCGL